MVRGWGHTEVGTSGTPGGSIREGQNLYAYPFDGKSKTYVYMTRGKTASGSRVNRVVGSLGS